MNIPAGFTADQIAALKTANPGVLWALPLAQGEAVPADVAPNRVLGWLDILEAPVEAGEALVLPGPIGAILAGLTKEGLAALRAKLSGAQPTERWTVAQIQTVLISSLPLPKT